MKSSSFLKKDRRAKKEFHRGEREAALIQELAGRQLTPGSLQLFLRAFKAEQVLEVWIKKKEEAAWQLFKSIPFCKSSGFLGPKRKEGDHQIPEGVYYIDRFNPQSKYHLSLGLNYPNASDRILGDPQEPGSDIFIHGGCETVGCIPITDAGIEEVYVLAGWARENEQAELPVHIYPFRFTIENWHSYGPEFPQHSSFWRQLESVYSAFEKEKILPEVQITATGEYRLTMV